MRREYYPDRIRVAALVFFLSLFAAALVGILVEAGFRSPDVAQNTLTLEVQRVLSLGSLVLVSVPMVALALLLVGHAPLLVIDDEGIIESGLALGMSMGRVRFSDMGDVTTFRVGLAFIGIQLVDADAFLLRDAPVMRRFLVRLNQVTRYPAITIMVAPMGVRAADVVAEILRAKAAFASSQLRAEADGA